MTSNEIVRMADAAQYEREAIHEEQRGKVKVTLIAAPEDPFGSLAVLNGIYVGKVYRSLSEVTEDQKRDAYEQLQKTTLSGPLEAIQFHFLIEGLTRSTTHQLVRNRFSFFAQESLRFAVPTGQWSEEIPVPPSLKGVQRRDIKDLMDMPGSPDISREELMLDTWEDAMINAQNAYNRLIELGMPAEEARDVMPHGMPTRIHWIVNLRALLMEAGKRTCTQAQFAWREIFGQVASELRRWADEKDAEHGADDVWHIDPNKQVGWQFRMMAQSIRPDCYQKGKCTFMADFDRNCTIRSRVNERAAAGSPSSEWHKESMAPDGRLLLPIHPIEWAADPSAARS